MTPKLRVQYGKIIWWEGEMLRATLPQTQVPLLRLRWTGGPWTKGIMVSSHSPELTPPPALVNVNLQMKFPLEQVSSTRSHTSVPIAFSSDLPSLFCLFTYLFLRQTLTMYPWLAGLQLAAQTRLASIRDPLPTSASWVLALETRTAMPIHPPGLSPSSKICQTLGD